MRDVVAAAELVIAGEGDAVAGGGLGAELCALLADEPWVRFTGHLDDDALPAFYSAMDVLALPSIDPLEAYGMVQVGGDALRHPGRGERHAGGPRARSPARAWD